MMNSVALNKTMHKDIWIHHCKTIIRQELLAKTQDTCYHYCVEWKKAFKENGDYL